MAEQILYISENAKNYSAGLKKLIQDISEEMTNGIKDGLAYKLARVENEEAKLYSFIKNEGYGISYKEFTGFLSDAKEIITANADFIEGALADTKMEQSSEELSDSDLEQVAGGGMKWWQWLLVGIAAVAIVVACVCIASVVASVGACLATVGVGAIAAGGLAGLVIATNPAIVAGIVAGVAIGARTAAG